MYNIHFIFSHINSDLLLIKKYYLSDLYNTKLYCYKHCPHIELVSLTTQGLDKENVVSPNVSFYYFL